MEVGELLSWLEGKGVFYWILVGALFVLLIKPDIGKRISLFFVACFTFFKWARKANVSRSFELNISSVANDINKEIGNEILPSNPKIKWVKNTTREAFVKDGKVVVKLDYDEDRNKSFALATSNYVNQGLLPITRQYLSDEIMQGCSLLVTRRIIKDKNKDSLDFFISGILEELFLDKPELKEKYDDLTVLDNNAMFLQILIPELWKMGRRIYPNNIKKDVVTKEVERLIKFLHTIASKKYDEIVKLELNSSLFKLRVMLVGRMDKLEGEGIRPYTNRVEQGIRAGFKSIYLLGYERKAEYLNQLRKKYEENSRIENIVIREGSVLNKSFDNMKCICVGLTVKDDSNEKQEVS